jgi:aspartate carbamoyltransferase catalytic subunit
VGESLVSLKGMDVVSAKDFTRPLVEKVFEVADEALRSPERFRGSLEGKRIALLFVEPSTRTYSSFHVAARRMGADVLPLVDPEMTSLAKGESLYDTLKMIEGYGVDCIVMRHPARGAAKYAADVVSVQVINAGSGSQEHPTQSLLDAYTIVRKRGSIDGLTIGFLGDLRFSRTVPSLVYTLSLFDGVTMHFMAPPALQLRPEVELHLRKRGVRFSKVEKQSEIPKVVAELDVLYVTRLQKERFPDPSEYERLRGSYRVDMELLSNARPNLGVMHPLPRVDELDPEVDRTPHAWYFEQASYGLPIRMALYYLILGD